MYAAGHLDKAEMMAGVGLGNMTMNLLCCSIIDSFNSSIETLGTQAAGAGNKKLCGIYLNRGRLIASIVLIPCILALMNVHHLFVYFGQPEETIFYMDQYITTYIPGLILFAMNDLQKKYLNSLGETKLTMTCLLFATALHYPWIYLMTQYYKLSVEGICYAAIITQLVSFVLLMMISHCNKEVR